jgi:uncharacterized protein (DUF4213/DUF364 family)
MNTTPRSERWELYDWLISRVNAHTTLRRTLLGLSWTVAESNAVGVCFSPVEVPRTLPWPGTLAGRSVRELSEWLCSFDPAEAAVALAALNSAINTPDNACAQRAQPLRNGSEVPPHLQVFAHFAPELSGAKVVVVGRYPGLDKLFSDIDYICLERRSNPDTLPDLASEYVLPEADFVFLTASAIANKSLPRLLELSEQAQVVLMGPSLPWLSEWADFGVDYLAGVTVRDASAAWQVAAEGGGTRLFEAAVEYRLLHVS